MVVLAGELDEGRAGDALGHVAGVLDLVPMVVGAVEDQRRHLDLREQVTLLPPGLGTDKLNEFLSEVIGTYLLSALHTTGA